MITSKTNSKDIKNIKRKIFSIKPKSTATTIRRESKSSRKNTHHRTSYPKGFIYSLSLSSLLSHQFLYPIHCKVFNGHEWLNPQLGPDRPKSQAMYDVLTIYQCKGVFYSIIFFVFILYYSSLYFVRGQTRERVTSKEDVKKVCIYWFQGLDARKRVTSNRTKKKDFIRKS